jgi:hypothetical protein
MATALSGMSDVFADQLLFQLVATYCPPTSMVPLIDDAFACLV